MNGISCTYVSQTNCELVVQFVINNSVLQGSNIELTVPIRNRTYRNYNQTNIYNIGFGQFIEDTTYTSFRKGIVDSTSTCVSVSGFTTSLICSINTFSTSNRVTITLTEALNVGTYSFKITNVTLPPNNY